MATPSRLIITAASQSYAQSLCALIGSLNVNWPGHPPILVYDIGLEPDTVQKLESHRIPVRKVPPFCPHWRKHYTWKLWCWQDAPAEQILWMDAGLVVLAPLDEIFIAIEKLGYFTVSNYQELTAWSHADACRACGVPPEFPRGRLTLAAGLVGMDKNGPMGSLVAEALSIAQDEGNIRATAEVKVYEQGIFSLLMYKYFHNQPVISDGQVYLGWLSPPSQVPGQKVWAHRRSLLPEDIDYYSRYLSGPGPAYLPQPPRDGLKWFLKRPSHVWGKIREKGLAHALRWGGRLIMSELGFRKEDSSRVRQGLRD